MRVRRGRSGRPWDRVRARVFAEETHCWLCGRWVDQSLPMTHPMSRTVDHLQELWQGGDPLDRTNARLAHRRCNSIKSNQMRGERRGDVVIVDASSL
ncbi:HNH endonuclease [Streptomyces sp. 891-h]|uniref:HNH endonuclease n=1 Tax=Streptomyces sp. 891-h TaxID=2720714 RepID=UPI0020602FA0|nr:HNH endonuclease [Streptomyces sp. 891-h]UNZ22190.1 HNH endonuclease [Streptomyces sp. 891-h]